MISFRFSHTSRSDPGCLLLCARLQLLDEEEYLGLMREAGLDPVDAGALQPDAGQLDGLGPAAAVEAAFIRQV